MTAAPPPPPPGYYPDQNRAGTERYWDGAQWTNATRVVSGVVSPPKKKPMSGWLIALIVVAGLILVVVVINIQNARGSGSSSSYVGSEKVVYEVEGTQKSGSITIQTPTGSSQQDVDIPMRSKAGTAGLTFTMSPGDFLYISVQGDKEYGTVTCRITVDGTKVSENTASGFGIATCQG